VGPLTGPGRRKRIAPFVLLGVAAAVIAYGVEPVNHDIPPLIISVALAAAVFAPTFLVPWEELPRSAQMVPPLLAVVAIFWVRHLLGGPVSGLSFLYLLPVVWSALYGIRGEVWIVAGTALLALALPLLTSMDAYAVPGEWTRTASFALVTILIGWAIGQGRRGESTDPLTHLPNRRVWWDAVDHEVARAERTGRPLCVVLIDLDNFKDLNDTMGHHAGDVHLSQCARAWEGAIRRHDVLARIGGEEFGLLLPEVAAPHAVAAVARLAEVMPPGGTFSAGIARWSPGLSADDLQRQADVALYRAKGEGRARTAIFDAAAGPPTVAPLEAFATIGAVT
jgi:diguanylate cyclase (GGDEF)-like protein